MLIKDAAAVITASPFLSLFFISFSSPLSFQILLLPSLSRALLLLSLPLTSTLFLSHLTSYSPTSSFLLSTFQIFLYRYFFFLYVKLFHKSCLSALFLLDSLLSHYEKICQQVSMQNQARTSIVSFVPSRVFSLRKSLFFIFI